MVVLPSILPVVMQRVHPPAGGVNCTPLLCVVDAFDWLTVYCGPGPMVRARGSFAGMDNLLLRGECCGSTFWGDGQRNLSATVASPDPAWRDPTSGPWRRPD